MRAPAPWRYPVELFRRFVWPPPRPTVEEPADHGLAPEPFTVVTDDRLTLRGWWFEPPDAWGVVVMCHARGANRARLLGQTRLLRDRGLAVVAFDFRGCGDSDPSRRWRGSLWDPLRDVAAVLRYVEARVADRPALRGRVALFGVSFGGNMVLAHTGTTSRRYPALIFDSTPLVRWQDMLTELLRTERRTARWPRVRAVVDRLVIGAVVWWTRAGSLYRHAERSARDLGGTRVLHIVGDRDTLFDVDESCRFLRTHHPDGTDIWRVRRGRHLTNHLVDPAGYADRVAAHLSSAFTSTDWSVHVRPAPDPAPRRRQRTGR